MTPASSTLLPQKLRTILNGITLLAVPMVVRNRVVGVVFVARTADQPPFSPDDIAVITMQVSHAALVVSHITLFDESLEMAVEMARRIDVIFMLDDINKAISSSLSHEKIIQTAMEHIERIAQCEYIAVLVQGKEQLDREGGAYHRHNRSRITAGGRNAFGAEPGKNVL